MNKLLKGRGQIFDIFVLLANLFLVGPLTALVRETKGFHPLFGVLLIAGVVIYSAGAWLKRIPLQERLSRGIGGTATIFFAVLFVLFVMHLGLFIAALSFAQEILEGYPGWGWTQSDTAKVAALVLGCVPTVLALRALVAPRNQVAREGEEGASRELVADFLIYLALIVLLAWWDGIFVEMVRTLPPQHWAMDILLSVLMLVPFAMFYLAPRILFLVEDYRDPFTWMTILFAVSPLILRN
jgi:hypothetical protein